MTVEITDDIVNSTIYKPFVNTDGSAGVEVYGRGAEIPIDVILAEDSFSSKAGLMPSINSKGELLVKVL